MPAARATRRGASRRLADEQGCAAFAELVCDDLFRAARATVDESDERFAPSFRLRVEQLGELYGQSKRPDARALRRELLEGRDGFDEDGFVSHWELRALKERSAPTG